MAAVPKKIAELYEPAEPGWWRLNKHRVFLIAGLIVGGWLGAQGEDPPEGSTPKPRPSESAHHQVEKPNR